MNATELSIVHNSQFFEIVSTPTPTNYLQENFCAGLSLHNCSVLSNFFSNFSKGTVILLIFWTERVSTE